jgi:ubiquinone/menaquinone biosynthesis C-methylase UbiE
LYSICARELQDSCGGSGAALLRLSVRRANALNILVVMNRRERERTASAAEEHAWTEANRAHWEAQASAHGTASAASWGDRYAMDLEVRNLLPHVPPGGRVLDAGCANGATTFRLLERGPAEVHGYDLSPQMIAAARRAAVTADPGGVIAFGEADILDLPEADATFDLACTIRVLINLPGWSAQQRAIGEIHRVLRPGGRYVLTEEFAGSLRNLNGLRALAGLPALSPRPFNCPLEEEDLESFVAPLFAIEEVAPFLSPYFVATRFLRDLALAGDEGPSYDSALHRAAAELPVTARSGDFGGIKCYVLRKHS